MRALGLVRAGNEACAILVVVLSSIAHLDARIGVLRSLSQKEW